MSNCRCMMQQIVAGLSRYMGQTVTIYTKSGGESGRGFTGVLIQVDPISVRLMSDMGPAPACALGSCCSKKHKKNPCANDHFDGFLDQGFDEGEEEQEEVSAGRNRINCGFRGAGAIVDIPITSIAAFVHNTL